MPREREHFWVLRHVPARVPISEAIGTAEPRDRGSLSRWFNYQYRLPARKFCPDKTYPLFFNNQRPKVAKICPEANQASLRTPRNIFTNIPRAYRGADTMYIYGYIVLSQRPKPRNVYHLPPHSGKHLFLVRGGICLKL